MNIFYQTLSKRKQILTLFTSPPPSAKMISSENVLQKEIKQEEPAPVYEAARFVWASLLL